MRKCKPRICRDRPPQEVPSANKIKLVAPRPSFAVKLHRHLIRRSRKTRGASSRRQAQSWIEAFTQPVAGLRGNVEEIALLARDGTSSNAFSQRGVLRSNIQPNPIFSAVSQQGVRPNHHNIGIKTRPEFRQRPLSQSVFHG